jgi:hypothetical protein
MAYSPPTRVSLRTSVQRDLRDPTAQTFLAAEVDDLINIGILEVSRVYPKEQRISVDVTLADQRTFIIGATSIFRVEVVKEGVTVFGVRVNALENHAQSGWDYHGGVLYLPEFVGPLDAALNSLNVWGYWPRATMHLDADVLDGNAECEYAVRAVATATGYQRLQNDRALFQQWRTNPLNSDVSPNQVAQMADFYMAHWDRLRKRIRIIQRV